MKVLGSLGYWGLGVLGFRVSGFSVFGSRRASTTESTEASCIETLLLRRHSMQTTWRTKAVPKEESSTHAPSTISPPCWFSVALDSLDQFLKPCLAVTHLAAVLRDIVVLAAILFPFSGRPEHQYLANTLEAYLNLSV